MTRLTNIALGLVLPGAGTSGCAGIRGDRVQACLDDLEIVRRVVVPLLALSSLDTERPR